MKTGTYRLIKGFFRILCFILLTPFLNVTRLSAFNAKNTVQLPPAVIDTTAERTLFTSVQGQYYRIPAIAATKDGVLIALSDDRHDTGRDIGGGSKLDVLVRRSLDGGNTWTEATKLADSEKFPNIIGFGDASIVADRTSNRVMVLASADSIGKLWGENGKLGVYRFYSEDGGMTWDDGTCITNQIYGLDKTWTALFLGSGKIMQSRIIKIKRYYRLYSVALIMCSKNNKAEIYGNAVLYSDDFGNTWNILGNTDLSPCSDGDEAKTEELPDGSVILSSRTNGRFYNIFRFSDKSFTSGQWEQYAAAESFTNINNACNGEILLVKAKEKTSGKKVNILLQSVPSGPGRQNVSVYYKVLNANEQYTPTTLGKGWKRFEVCNTESAYSTMCVHPDGCVAFLYERVPKTIRYSYDIVYIPLGLDLITNGIYEGITDNPKAMRRLKKLQMTQ